MTVHEGTRRGVVRAVLRLALSTLLLVALAACNSRHTTTTADAGPAPRDAGIVDAIGDGRVGGLWRCAEPGKACNAHDDCAINPICGADFLCRPTSRQSCDDNLECTTDRCKGRGLCAHDPKPGTCAVVVRGRAGAEIKCVNKGDVHPGDPCLWCDPDASSTQWSGRTGGICNDGNDCTMNDTCNAGTCKGTYYGHKCSDGLDCTDDICNGKGGCTNKLKSNVCLVGTARTCYKLHEKDVTGCSRCEPKTSQSALTKIDDVCNIGGRCFEKGARDNTGCASCDPDESKIDWTTDKTKCRIQGLCHADGTRDRALTCRVCDAKKSTSAWSLTKGTCLIAGACHKDGATSATGCGVCRSATNSTWWVPAAGTSTVKEGFDASLGGFTVDAAKNNVGWRRSTKRARTGSGSLYYGKNTFTSYDAGAAIISRGVARRRNVRLPAGQKAALHFWLYMDTETSTKFDVLTLKVDTTVVWTKNDTTMPASNYRRWVPVEVDLSAHAGKTVTIEIAFDTVDGFNNDTEGVAIDDLAVLTNCGRR